MHFSPAPCHLSLSLSVTHTHILRHCCFLIEFQICYSCHMSLWSITSYYIQLGYGISKCGGTQPRAAAYSHFKLLKKPTTLQAVINIRVVNMATVAGAECVFPDLQHVRHMLQTKSACNSHEQNLDK